MFKLLACAAVTSAMNDGMSNTSRPATITYEVCKELFGYVKECEEPLKELINYVVEETDQYED